MAIGVAAVERASSRFPQEFAVEVATALASALEPALPRTGQGGQSVSWLACGPETLRPRAV